MAAARLRRVELLVERPSTKAHLIDVGEELFGLYGLDGISLREIAASAGQANVNVVQYHFGDKLGLIRAILEDRILQLERIRREMLEGLAAAGHQRNRRALLAAILLPALNFQNARSGHVFCRFLLQCYIHPDSGYDDVGGRHDALRRQKKRKKGDAQLAIVQIVELLQESFAEIPPTVLLRRLKAVHLMFMACVVEFDNARKAGKRHKEFDPEPILDMAVGALSAPS